MGLLTGANLECHVHFVRKRNLQQLIMSNILVKVAVGDNILVEVAVGGNILKIDNDIEKVSGFFYSVYN
jgi:hypothetical protein